MTGGNAGSPRVRPVQHCGEIDIRIARDGTWFHEGAPIVRPELVRLFARHLHREPDGFHIVTPAEKMRITVDDAPFLAVGLRRLGHGSAQTLAFTTNIGDEAEAGADNPIRVDSNPVTGEPAPYVHVRHGLEARIVRPVFYELADLAVPGAHEHEGFLGVWSKNVFFRLGRAA
jgi:uncharacterized protein